MKEPTPAAAVIERFGLNRHPEGGWYRETWRSEMCVEGRALCSAILFLLDQDERSHWHRVDADELWLWHAGSALMLRVAQHEGAVADRFALGPDVLAGQSPQVRVPARSWQAAEPVTGWTLVSCIVAPAFTFDGFELAPPNWSPT
jgi:predicted cupin superfamily sugar epimerase